MEPSFVNTGDCIYSEERKVSAVALPSSAVDQPRGPPRGGRRTAAHGTMLTGRKAV